ALLGAWQGEFHCQWDTIGFTLNIAESESREVEAVDAVFSFFSRPDGPAIPAGSFEMSGDYDPEDGTIVLKSKAWIKRPLGIQRHNLSGRAEIGGTAISGRIESPGCTEFYLARNGRRGLPTAQSQ
ncbi:MAG: hypothetical protein ACR2Q4_15850, partial [Geminicoccaceae bacterium]